MKRKLIVFAIIVSFLIPAKAQEKEEKLKQLENLEQPAQEVTPSDTLISEEEEMVATVEGQDYSDTIKPESEKQGDTIYENNRTVIRVGNQVVSIITDDGETDISFDRNDNDRHFQKHHRKSFFDGHLGGIELGYNNFSTDKWGQNSSSIDSYLDLKTAKSTCFNMIFPSVSAGITSHFGIVSAIGLNFNNYRFEGNNSVIVGTDGVLGPYYPESGINYEKSKLTTVYGIIPVMLELQIPVSSGNTINLGAGVVGAVKLGSHTKVVYFDDGKQKEKNHDDFNLSVLRYGVTARVGYEMVQVYGTCYLSPMFEKDKGPVLYPFEVGIALTIND